MNLRFVQKVDLRKGREAVGMFCTVEKSKRKINFNKNCNGLFALSLTYIKLAKDEDGNEDVFFIMPTNEYSELSYKVCESRGVKYICIGQDSEITAFKKYDIKIYQDVENDIHAITLTPKKP